MEGVVELAYSLSRSVTGAGEICKFWKGWFGAATGIMMVLTNGHCPISLESHLDECIYRALAVLTSLHLQKSLGN